MKKVLMHFVHAFLMSFAFTVMYYVFSGVAGSLLFKGADARSVPVIAAHVGAAVLCGICTRQFYFRKSVYLAAVLAGVWLAGIDCNIMLLPIVSGGLIAGYILPGLWQIKREISAPADKIK